MISFSKLRFLYQNRISVLGCSSILWSLYFFIPAILTFKCLLMPLSGTIRSSDSSSKIVSNTGRYGHEILSRSSILVFSLREYNKNFSIAQGSLNPLFNGYTEIDKIASYLENSKKVVVWIKRWDKSNLEPEVFQIDIDGRTELNFEPKRTRSFKIFTFLLIFGSSCIYLGYRIEISKKK